MRRLEQRDAVTGRCECVGRGEAINTHADGGDVEIEGGAAAIVETGQVFEGNVWESVRPLGRRMSAAGESRWVGCSMGLVLYVLTYFGRSGRVLIPSDLRLA